MIKHKTEWSFTDQPDVFRICRELNEAGCPLGLATRADGQITLVDVGECPWPGKVLVQIRQTGAFFHVFGSWYCLKGDHVAALLKVSPVTVRGYKPSASGL